MDADTNLMDIARSFSESEYRRYPVIDNNCLGGIIGRRDAWRAAPETL